MTGKELRRIGWGAYGVALLLIAIPLLDTIISIWPLRVGDVTWRFGAVGLSSRAVMTPLLGLVVGLATAIIMQHRVAVRTFAVLGFVGAVLALVAMGFFTLDALQTRAQVRPEASGAFDTASAMALFKLLAGFVVALLLGIGGWRAGRKRRGVAGAGAADEGSMLMSTRERTEPERS